MKPIGRLQSGAGNLLHRSNGRRLSAIGATTLVLGALPPWWTIGGSGLAPQVGGAFDSPGFIGFFAALVALFVIVAPEAFGAPLRVDWWPVHLALVGVATLAIADSVVGAAITATGSRLPLSSVFGVASAPGLWLTLIGLALWIAGVAQVVDARDDR
jgi:hypothetical protein